MLVRPCIVLWCASFVLRAGGAVTVVDEHEIPELKYMNKSVNPCDDFYEYTCGNFKTHHPLPTGTENIDHFTILQNEIHELVKKILRDERRDDDPIGLQKAKAFYSACMNVNYINYLQLPQLNVLDSLGEWPAISTVDNGSPKLTWTEIGNVIAEYGVPFYFDFSVMGSMRNETANVIFLQKDGLASPDAGLIGRDEFDYLEMPKIGRRASKQPLPFRIFLQQLAYRLRAFQDYPKPDEEVGLDLDETIKYMQTVKAGGVVPDDVGDIMLASEITVKVLQEWTDKHFGENYMSWVDFLNAVAKYSGAVITEDTIVMQASIRTVYGLLNLHKISNAAQIRNFLIARLLTHMAPDSDDEMRESLKKFYEAHGYTIYPRPEYCLRKTLGYPDNIDFSIAITYEYQKYHFNVNKLKNAADMVLDLRDSFKQILDKVPWMDSESRDKAKEKEKQMITLLGYPDYAEQGTLLDEFYENLRICTWDHFGNSQRLRAFRKALAIRDIGQKRNRELWNLSPLQVNAYYNRNANRILFPVAVLNPVFFNGDISVLDYARIGAVIGHEITHAYDSAGMTYGPLGTLVSWGSNKTKAAFEKRTECFEEQYGQYFIEEIGKYVNATKTLNENIADNGGLRTAFMAFNRLMGRMDSAKIVKGYSPEQMFFIGYGTMWCMNESPFYIGQMHEKQVYATGKYRVIGTTSNMQEFANAFNCPKNSKMNPEKKCILW